MGIRFTTSFCTLLRSETQKFVGSPVLHNVENTPSLTGPVHNSTIKHFVKLMRHNRRFNIGSHSFWLCQDSSNFSFFLGYFIFSKTRQKCTRAGPGIGGPGPSNIPLQNDAMSCFSTVVVPESSIHDYAVIVACLSAPPPSSSRLRRRSRGTSCGWVTYVSSSSTAYRAASLLFSLGSRWD